MNNSDSMGLVRIATFASTIFNWIACGCSDFAIIVSTACRFLAEQHKCVPVSHAFSLRNVVSYIMNRLFKINVKSVKAV